MWFYVPIKHVMMAEAFLEVWLEPGRDPGSSRMLPVFAEIAIVGSISFCGRLGGVARRPRTTLGMHRNLFHAFTIAFIPRSRLPHANEGRQLAGCDRLSVAMGRSASEDQARGEGRSARIWCGGCGGCAIAC